jgi:PAS domain-containing protein
LTSVDQWSAATQAAHEPCLVIDDVAAIAAVSQSACSMLGFSSPDDVIGCFLYSNNLLALVDFTPASAALSDADMEKIPPMLALHSGRLARGLMRVRSGADVVTMDAIATPLLEHDKVIGSLTFFSLV